MSANLSTAAPISSDLIEALRSFPLQKHVEHCGSEFVVSPFEFYATCPRCGTKLKVRAFSALPELADVFDAVFEWLNQPGADALADLRRAALRDDAEA